MRKRRCKEKPVAGIAWYRPEQWQLLREFSVDAEDLEETHAEWLAIANRMLRDLERKGVSVLKVDMDVEELLNWCREEGVKLDGAARASVLEHEPPLCDPEPAFQGEGSAFAFAGRGRNANPSPRHTASGLRMTV